jgi:hypothetical protein
MTVPVQTQPNVEPGLLNQTHIALNLFNTILKTTTNRVELEQSWAAIERDINIQEQFEARQPNEEISLSFLLRRLTPSLLHILTTFGCLDTVLLSLKYRLRNNIFLAPLPGNEVTKSFSLGKRQLFFVESVTL